MSLILPIADVLAFYVEYLAYPFNLRLGERFVVMRLGGLVHQQEVEQLVYIQFQLIQFY